MLENKTQMPVLGLAADLRRAFQLSLLLLAPKGQRREPGPRAEVLQQRGGAVPQPARRTSG